MVGNIQTDHPQPTPTKESGNNSGSSNNNNNNSNRNYNVKQKGELIRLCLLEERCQAITVHPEDIYNGGNRRSNSTVCNSGTGQQFS